MVPHFPEGKTKLTWNLNQKLYDFSASALSGATVLIIGCPWAKTRMNQESYPRCSLQGGADSQSSASANSERLLALALQTLSQWWMPAAYGRIRIWLGEEITLLLQFCGSLTRVSVEYEFCGSSRGILCISKLGLNRDLYSGPSDVFSSLLPCSDVTDWTVFSQNSRFEVLTIDIWGYDCLWT